MRNRRTSVWVTLALCAAACQTQSGARRTADEPQTAVAHPAVEDVQPEPGSVPMDLSEAFDTTLAYLLDKYDANGDGGISREEYDRSDTTFERLDRNRDDSIGEDDFRRDGDSMAERMRLMRTQRIMARYFQDDRENDKLSLEELERGIAHYDTNFDGLLAREEFTALSEEHRVQLEGDDGGMIARMMDGVEPWDALVAGTDSDDDGMVAGMELVSFFQAMDDGDLVWSLGRGPSSPRPVTGPVAGNPAPDFTLLPPSGGDPVTLSSFAGSKPVALIFGSYT